MHNGWVKLVVGGEEMGWMDVAEPRHSQKKVEIIANPRLGFGCSVFCALGSTASAEFDGKERG